ncbi:MAG: poly(R)-hydroxyalkanoic acid synthase subunit PhaE [Pseudomonadota bacterium]
MNQNEKNPFLNQDWIAMQKQMMDIWMNYGQSNPTLDSNWADAMQTWWKAVMPDSALGQNDLFNKMLEQSRMYYFLSEQFSKIQSMFDSSQYSDRVLNKLLKEQFQKMTSLMTEKPEMFSWSQLADQFEQPAELFQQLFSNAQAFSGIPMNEWSPELKKIREKFLTMPGLGYSRESQEKAQEAFRLWAEYQDNYQEFNKVMSGLNNDAMDLMRKRLMKMHKDGEAIESVRQVYHIWVDSNEKVYSDFVFTEEYAELNARLVNSLMAFKNKSQEITEDYLKSMNLPTTSAVEALERRQHDLRKQVRAIEIELKSVRAELKSSQIELKENKEAKTVEPVNSKKTKAKAKRKVSKKRKTKKTIIQTSSQVVDFNASKKKKNRKLPSKSKKTEANNDSGMIEIKF